MAITPSNMMKLGTKAPDFTLPNVITGTSVSLSEYANNMPVVVAFICNHCPYVKHIIDKFVALGNEYDKQGVKFIAISSNDVTAYPEDSPEKMKVLATNKGFNFPYCYDQFQEVAKKYDAACTPDFFLFNLKHELVYCGQFDGTRPNTKTYSDKKGSTLESAVANTLYGINVPAENQNPSVGCNIKWKNNIT